MRTALWVIVPAIAVALAIFSIVDIITIDERRVRGLPKFLWVAIVLLPFIGAILWLTIGRARADDGGGRGGQRRVIAPDDDPNFLRNLRRDEEADERIRRLEQELSELDDDPPKD
jgi:hypothetical protein